MPFLAYLHVTPLCHANIGLLSYVESESIKCQYNNVLYLTDTGRTWAGKKVSVKDVVNTSYDQKVSTTNGVIDLIKSEQFFNICLVVHPHRWCDNFSAWLWELVWQNAKNVGKRGIVWYRARKTVNV